MNLILYKCQSLNKWSVKYWFIILCLFIKRNSYCQNPLDKPLAETVENYHDDVLYDLEFLIISFS